MHIPYRVSNNGGSKTNTWHCIRKMRYGMSKLAEIKSRKAGGATATRFPSGEVLTAPISLGLRFNLGAGPSPCRLGVLGHTPCCAIVAKELIFLMVNSSFVFILWMAVSSLTHLSLISCRWVLGDGRGRSRNLDILVSSTWATDSSYCPGDWRTNGKSPVSGSKSFMIRAEVFGWWSPTG